MSKNEIRDDKGGCAARTVLWYLVFMGFGVNYMLRTNLNMAIVSMVKNRDHNVHILTSECLLNRTPEISSNNSDINVKINTFQNTFSWDEKEQSHVLGAFFWLHWVTQLPGGLLASKYGTKVVFGFSNFVAVLICFLIPMGAKMGYHVLIGLRIFQGIVAGFAWPSVHNMAARWIPPNERSKFVTAYLGSSVGVAVTYPVCSFIINHWGWEWVFYTSGVVGTTWFMAWWFLVYDSPTMHPRITEEEKNYILDSLGQTYSKEKAPVPWRSIWFSVPVWMNILAQWGGIWGFFTLMTHGPSYFKFIHGFSIQTTGVVSGLGHLLRTSWAYVSALLGDYLLRTNKMSRNNVRKLATSCCTIGQGIFIAALAYSGCDSTTAVIFLTIAVTLNGAVSTGPLASIVDISPNYASVVLGMINSVAAIAGMISPLVVGHLINENQTVEQWRKVYLIASAMLFTTGILYVIFSKSDLQAWNSPDKVANGKETELMTIKTQEEKAVLK